MYEIAGAANTVDPSQVPLNGLDHTMILRSLFVRGDEWVRWDVEPPASRVMAEDISGAPDPVYGFPTGIARDTDLNAVGGVRFPDIEVGRAQFIAADFSIGPIPGLAGGRIDLACEPAPDGSTRFPNHGSYVSRSVKQVNALRKAGFLLDADADVLKEQAAESNVGQPGSCP
ncbi:MAG: alpha/beta hydrolase domain-containing protein [Acidobacteriota bacterium]